MKKNMVLQDDKTRIRVLFILPATRRRLEKDLKKIQIRIYRGALKKT